MASKEELFKFFSPWIVVSEPNPKGEWRTKCPIHKETRASASINFGKGFFSCQVPSCPASPGLSLTALRKMMSEMEDVEEASYDPFATSDKPSNVISINRKQAAHTADKTTKPLTEALVRSWHRGLVEAKRELTDFMSKRGISMETINTYQLGFDFRAGRYIIPIRDSEGTLVNVRRYLMGGDHSQKMWNYQGLGSPPRLFPLAVLEASDEIVITEGELDALICIQNGIPAVSGTGGAGRWDPGWTKSFSGKKVWICYDNDKAGRIAARKVEQAIRHVASETRIMPPLLEDVGGSDATDFFTAGGTAEQFKAMMASAPLANKEPEEPSAADTVDVSVIDSMDASTNGRTLRMVASITGFKHPTYSVPKEFTLDCTLDAGPKCKVCPMNGTYEGAHSAEVKATDAETIARFIDANEEARLDVIRKMLKLQRCTRLNVEYDGYHTVSEVFVAPNVDRHGVGRSDYTQRRAYVVGQHKIDANSVASLTGTTWPNPKDSRNEFYAWDVKPETTSIDSFTMTPELHKRLKKFQPRKGQKPIAKCTEIAHEMIQSVTGIQGRERLHIAMDLVFHSVLNFEFDGKLLDRGWLDFIVVGDTRTGKSETALRLSEHYKAGHVIGCESATFAGLVGGVKQIGKEWAIQWGEITVNDRRLVVLDEASGLSHDIIGKMSDVRSRGIAQVTAIETRQTKARCRAIWISNPRRPKYIDERRTDGIDIIEELIGNQEDIARFDFAMSVRSSDVPLERVNMPREKPEPKYTSDDCHELVLWAWSRKPEHVRWMDRAYHKVYEGAEWLGKRYVEHPPLINRANVKEKIARMAVAFAARLFSTDETGELVLVQEAHVDAAVNFIHKLYQYDNFGYGRVSARWIRNQETANSRRLEVRAWLRENPRVFEFLVDRKGSFRAQDLEEMAFMERTDVNMALNVLADAKMISKEKSQIVLEPVLQSILRDMEKVLK